MMNKDNEEIKILCDFVEELSSNSEDLDSSIIELVNENFWELI